MIDMAGKTIHEVVYGGLGSGKSGYAFGIIDPEETFKLGVGGRAHDLLLMKLGSTRRHEDDTSRRGIAFKSTTLRSVIRDISNVEYPTLLIDEWTSFFSYSFWWPEQEIAEKANSIIDAVESNEAIERGVYIALDYVPYTPLNIYKKNALWNRILFARADEITRIDYGLATRIK